MNRKIQCQMSNRPKQAHILVCVCLLALCYCCYCCYCCVCPCSQSAQSIYPIQFLSLSFFLCLFVCFQSPSVPFLLFSSLLGFFCVKGSSPVGQLPFVLFVHYVFPFSLFFLFGLPRVHIFCLPAPQFEYRSDNSPTKSTTKALKI